MYALLAVLSALSAVGSFVYFQRNGGAAVLVTAVVFVVITVVTGGIFLSTKLNKKEDIHITN